MPDVILSSTCFTERNLESLCQLLVENNFNKIELSGNILYIPDEDLLELLLKFQNRIVFEFHNYFPAPQVPFVLNLAHTGTSVQSINHCKKAIDLCSILGRKNYSLHGGLSINPDPKELGHDQSHLESMDMDESRKILFESCQAVAQYAQDKKVRLLLENNVVAGFNCPDGVNTRYHLSDLNESIHLLHIFDHPNIGILLDTGHLKVSAQTLDFNPIEFIKRFNDKIKVVQISENDGTSDQNLPVREDSWFWSYISWDQVDYVSLEVSGLSLEDLLQQIELTKTQINKLL